MVSPSAVLVVIDLQYGTVVGDPAWGSRSTPQLELTVERLLQRWRQSNRPVVHVQHDDPDPADLLHAASHPDSYAIHPCAAPLPGEPLVVKQRSSAFQDTELQQHLDKHNTKELVMIGMDACNCVQTSTRHASDLGYQVTVVADATACFSTAFYDDPAAQLRPVQEVHQMALSMLHGSFATVVNSEQLLSNF